MTRYHKILISIIAFIAVCSALYTYVFTARYEIVSQHSLAANRGTFSRIEVRGDDQSPPFTLYCVILTPGNTKALLIDQPRGDGEHLPRIKSIARDFNAAVVINGGYFTADFAPDGLCIVNGKQTSPLSDKPALSGIVAIDDRGRIDLLLRDGDVTEARDALQAGPFVIDAGGLPGIRSESYKRAAGTIIAKSTDGRTLIIVADNVSLYQLSQFMAASPEAFGVTQIDRALNLDGGPSTALHVKAQGAELTINPTPRVRNFIAVK